METWFYNMCGIICGSIWLLPGVPVLNSTREMHDTRMFDMFVWQQNH